MKEVKELLKTSVSSSIGDFTVDEDGIVYMTFKAPKIKIELEDAKGIYNAKIQLSPPGTRQLFLVDLTSVPRPTQEARNYTKSDEMVQSTKAMAFIVDGPLSRILGNFFLGFNRGDYSVKLFTDKTEAKEWLMRI